MFKPVTGNELNKFDPETSELFRRRESDAQTTLHLMNIPRRARNQLPLFIDKEKNKAVVELEKAHESYWWKFLVGFGFFCKSQKLSTVSNFSNLHFFL